MVEEAEVNVNGTLIWYYYVCKREVWLMGRKISPDEDDSNIELGRFIHENAYEREKKEVSLGNIKIDIVKAKDGQIVIGEVKKSSKFLESAEMQLAYYLYQLWKIGINGKGELLFPKEKKKIQVELTDNKIKELKEAEKDILTIIYSNTPPAAKKIPFCKSCAYAELCWA